MVNRSLTFYQSHRTAGVGGSIYERRYPTLRMFRQTNRGTLAHRKARRGWPEGHVHHYFCSQCGGSTTTLAPTGVRW